MSMTLTTNLEATPRVRRSAEFFPDIRMALVGNHDQNGGPRDYRGNGGRPGPTPGFKRALVPALIISAIIWGVIFGIYKLLHG